MKYSLQNRLLVRVIIGIALLLTGFSLIIYFAVRQSLFGHFDSSLLATAQILAASVEADEGEIELGFEAQQLSQFDDLRTMSYQIRKDDGTVAAQSVTFENENIDQPGEEIGKAFFKTLTGKKGKVRRIVELRFLAREEVENEQQGEYTDTNSIEADTQRFLSLVVTADASDIYRQLSFLRWLLLMGTAAVTSLSVIIAVVAVREGLGPLNRIASEIGGITEEDLSIRVGAGAVPAEIVPIKSRLNDMLDRLEGAFGRERQFTADVAHELRTPLAGVRSTIEVCLLQEREAAAYQKSLGECLAIVEDMQAMVNNLLMIARLDSGRIAFSKEEIPLAELVESCRRDLADRLRERKINFENRISKDFVIHSDWANVSMIFSNLLRNAVEYADENGQVRVEAGQADGKKEIVISNTGCRLSDEQLVHIFDCFWRADMSRDKAGGHCGLGLSLTRKIVKALGGECKAQITDDRVFVIKITLP